MDRGGLERLTDLLDTEQFRGPGAFREDLLTSAEFRSELTNFTGWRLENDLGYTTLDFQVTHNQRLAAVDGVHTGPDAFRWPQDRF